MGAETSTLQGIDSLSASLLDLERKLTIIEDSHLHHERTITHDNTVLISEKKILCRPGVSLTVGPIIGLVGPESARILIETDTSADITFYFFLLDELGSKSKFLFEEV